MIKKLKYLWHLVRVVLNYHRFYRANRDAFFIFFYAVGKKEAEVLGRVAEMRQTNVAEAFINVVSLGFWVYNKWLEHGCEGCGECGAVLPSQGSEEYESYIG
jgi:hypothetical protein